MAEAKIWSVYKMELRKLAGARHTGVCGQVRGVVFIHGGSGRGGCTPHKVTLLYLLPTLPQP